MKTSLILGAVALATAAGCSTVPSGGGAGGGGNHPPIQTLLGVLDTAVAIPSATASAHRAGADSSLVDSLTPTGEPFGAAVNKDGIAYITLHGGINALGRWDFSTRTYTDTVVMTGSEPTNVSFSPDGATAYVAAQLSDRVDVVDVATNTIITSPTTPGNDPYQTVASPDGTKFFASGNGDAIWIFDAMTRTGITHIPVAEDPNGMAISPDGSKMFISHLSSGVIGRITLATGVFDTLATVGGTPVHGIDVSPDGSKVYVVSQGTDSLYAFDATTGAKLGQVYAGSQPFGLAATPDGTEIWISAYGGDLRRFHSSDLSPITTLTLGGHLRRLAIDPYGRGAIIADEDGRLLVMK